MHLLVNPSCEMRNEKRREVKKSIKEKKSNKSKKGHRLVVSIQLSSLRAPFRAFCVWIKCFLPAQDMINVCPSCCIAEVLRFLHLLRWFEPKS